VTDVTPEVTKSLDHRPVVVAPPRPEVFNLIIQNNNRTDEILRKGFDMSQADWRELKELRRDLRESLIPGAERALKWNRDKGQTK
jgi:fructose-1-phosphate kinase PfkB-like protein